MRLIAAMMILTCCGVLPGRAGEPRAVVPFEVGEKLHYRMFWGPLQVGTATLEVKNIEMVDGQDCYHLIAKAGTTGLGRALYSFDSQTESWVDRKGLFTRQFRQDYTEGKKTRKTETRFDYVNKQAVTRNTITGQEKQQPLEQPVQDLVSCIYFVRSQPLALNEERNFIVNASNKNFDVRIRPDSRQKMTLRPVGEVSALRVEPTPTLRFVAQNKGRMWFWVSEDDRRVPLVVNSTTAIGNARLVLVRVDAPPSPQLTAIPQPPIP